MTQDEIDPILADMQAQAEASGQEGDLPGLITFQTDDWVRSALPCCCTSPQRGIRYRGVKILVSRERQTRIWSRDEALVQGEAAEPFEALKSIEDAKV